MLACNENRMDCSAVIVAGSLRAVCIAFNLPSCVGRYDSVFTNDRITRKTNSEGTNPFWPAVLLRG